MTSNITWRHISRDVTDRCHARVPLNFLEWRDREGPGARTDNTRCITIISMTSRCITIISMTSRVTRWADDVTHRTTPALFRVARPTGGVTESLTARPTLVGLQVKVGRVDVELHQIFAPKYFATYLANAVRSWWEHRLGVKVLCKCGKLRNFAWNEFYYSCFLRYW